MNKKKQVSIILFLLIGLCSLAQTENVFLERSFWKGNPSLQVVQQKISEGYNPAELNSNAFDGVVYALLEKADDAVLKHLLSVEGNPVDKKTHDSRIYLHWAAYAGNINIVSYLLENGSSVTAKDSHGATPLVFAANAGQKESALYEVFEKHGVHIENEKSEDGANVLLLVAPSLTTNDEIQYFISKGLPLDSTDDNGNGIFNYAAKKGNIDFLKLLVKKGVAYKPLNTEGGNAFLFAAQGGRGYSNGLNVYEYLKGLGIEPNVVTKEGYTPLHRLAYNTADPAIIQFFLSAGANVNQQDANGNTPFHNAAFNNEIKIVKLLSNQVTDFNSSNNDGQNPLMLAVQRNSVAVVTFLLNKGGNALAKDSKGNGTPYYAVQSFNSKNPEIFDKKVALLQEKGVAMNTVQAEGNTLLHLAAKANDLDLLKRVADFNIAVNAKNNEGLTALHLAAMKAENDQLMKYLISLGADTKIKTDFDETVYDLANENELLKKQHVALKFLK